VITQLSLNDVPNRKNTSTMNLQFKDELDILNQRDEILIEEHIEPSFLAPPGSKIMSLSKIRLSSVRNKKAQIEWFSDD
jgi:hypothetical protein